jgi:hypothetical protein
MPPIAPLPELSAVATTFVTKISASACTAN